MVRPPACPPEVWHPLQFLKMTGWTRSAKLSCAVAAASCARDAGRIVNIVVIPDTINKRRLHIFSFSVSKTALHVSSWRGCAIRPNREPDWPARKLTNRSIHGWFQYVPHRAFLSIATDRGDAGRAADLRMG